MSTMIFVSYSHRDKRWFERFMRMAKPLQKYAQVDLWADVAIKSGETWIASIQNAMKDARIAVLLVSDGFLESEFITTVELPRLIKARREDGLHLFWVLLSPCLYKLTPLRHIQAVGNPAEPLNSLNEYGYKQVFCELCEKIDLAVKELEKPVLSSKLASTSLLQKNENLQVLAKPAFRETELLVYSHDNAWHVQAPIRKGSTRTTCWIGDEKTKSGTPFKIVALTRGETKLRESSKHINLPSYRTKSKEVTVRRA